MTARNYTNTASSAQAAVLLNASDTSLALANFSGYPAVPFTAVIDRNTEDEEVVLVTNVSSSTVTMTRGYDGTTAKAHAAGASFLHAVVALDFEEANDHVNDATGVHGVAGALVGTTDAQTLTNKTLSAPTISNPTHTGTTTAQALALSGGLTGTSATLSGNASVGGTLGVTGNTTLGGTLAVTGAVTAATAPSAGSHLVNKTALDAAVAAGVAPLDTRLDAAEATLATATAAEVANAPVKRDANGDAALGRLTLNDTTGLVGSHAARRDWVTEQIGDVGSTFTPVTIVGTGWTGNIYLARVNRLCTVMVNIERTSQVTINAWDFLQIAGSMPASISSQPLGVLNTNAYETSAYQLYINSSGNMFVQARWSQRVANIGAWFRGSFTYIAAEDA